MIQMDKDRQRILRERRLKRKRKRQLYRRLLIITLILITGLAVFGTVKLVSFLLDKNSNEKTPVNQTIEENSEKDNQGEATEDEEKPVEEVQILVSLAGDCTLATDVEYAGGDTFVKKYNEVQNPVYFLSEVQSVFANDDLTIVNFEGTLSESGSRQDKRFAFRGDPEYVDILTKGSVEAANLANNHSRDYGEISYTDTQKYLDEAGIVNFGYEETAIYECKGVKIGLVGIYELAEGIGCKDQLIKNIQKVKEEGAVITIVSFHWGIETENYPTDVQKELGHIAVDSGADLVVGHHPHVLQGIETYNGKKIVYSLGNFCFGGNKNPKDKDTMIFQQTFTVQDGELVLDENINIIPCSISSVSTQNNYQPIILQGSEAERVLKKINTFSDGL